MVANRNKKVKQKGSINRRQFMGAAAASVGVATLSGCGGDSNGMPTQAGENRDVRFGMIALTDCSPIVIAHEKGLFRKYGINSTVVKGASWAAIRDSLINGDIQASHLLFGIPFASTMGLQGPPVPMIIPWMMNRNGQAISLKSSLRGQVQADPRALRPLVMAAKEAGTPMTFAMTFPPGTHAMWMRYWLAAGGIDPDQDVRLIVIPPAQMFANMRTGSMDGFCVGEPWNARVIAENIGYTALTTQDLWPDHPEKVLGMRADFAERNPNVVKDILKALHEASVWLDNLENRREQCDIVSRPTYINCPPEIILGRLMGQYDYGDGRTKQDDHYMIFSQRNCNYPQKKYGVWWLTQFRRWGMVRGVPNYDGVCSRVLRPDIYEEAMREINYVHGGPDNSPERFFDDGVFDPTHSPEEYAQSFPVKNVR